ncbi:protein FAM228B-like isoform X3 [Dendrobates tinctorius]|uniref:protein FAM228B-like isoform X3 n=1 Tax=Dendrobates tinctorius TaxID=92724 RepID=UPI003CC9475F
MAPFISPRHVLKTGKSQKPRLRHCAPGSAVPASLCCSSARTEAEKICGMLHPTIKDRMVIHSAPLPKELLPSPEQAKSVNFWNSFQKHISLPPLKMMPASHPGIRSLSTTSLRKTGDWLSHKPYVQGMLHPTIKDRMVIHSAPLPKELLPSPEQAKLLGDQESREISAMTQCVLDTENLYNQTVDEYVAQTEQAEQCRREIQHKRWTEQVADPIQRAIEKYIDNQSSEDIEKRRRRLLAQYLQYCNKKVSTLVFPDPLLQQSQKRYEEEKTAMHCDTGRAFFAKEIHELTLQKLPRVPLGRQSMNGAEWLKTPLGYIESDIRLKSRHRVSGSCNQESLDFKPWVDTKYPPEIIRREMKISQKRRFPERPSSLPTYCKHWGPVPPNTITA